MRLQTACFAFLLLLITGTGQLLAQPLGLDAQHTTTSGEMAMQRALDHYRDGKLNEAAGLLRGFVISQADSPLVNQAYYYLARIHSDLDEPMIATDYLARMSADSREAASELLAGELLIRTGKATQAVQQLLTIDATDWTLNEQQERDLLLAEGLLNLDQPHQALYFYHLAQLTEGRETPREILARIHTLLSDRFCEADLAEAAFMYRNQPTSYMAMLQLGWRAVAAGNKPLAQEWATAALGAPVGFAYREETLLLQSQLTDSSQLQRAIGVLLPLSGRYASFGQLVQRGMDLAIETQRPEIPVHFIYRDTAGDETVAAQQVAELAISERVMGIAGPLVGNAATGAARRANRERVPLLTLSQREGLAASSLYVFRNSLTPQLQIKALVDYAIDERGFSEFAILHPQTKQGELYAEVFRETVLRRGGVVVAEQSYLTEQTDFRHQTRLLRGLEPAIPEDEEELAMEEELPPPFEALFIPDYADRISLIAPQLVFYGLDDIQLLGTSGWNDAELPRIAGQFVEGAIFTAGFFRHSNYPFVQEFVELYFNKYGEDPTLLEAQGYDIAGILLTLLNRADIRSREDLRQALAQLQNYPGVTGATRFDFTGEADKVLFLLQIQDGNIVQIN